MMITPRGPSVTAGKSFFGKTTHAHIHSPSYHVADEDCPFSRSKRESCAFVGSNAYTLTFELWRKTEIAILSLANPGSLDKERKGGLRL